jgi:PAS domain S-box-containing protein
MTSFGDEEMAVKAIKSGAMDYIVKSTETFKNIGHVVERNLRDWNNIRERIESERKFRVLFETMAQGVIYQDKNKQIISVNPAAEKILCASFDQLRSRNFFDPVRWGAIKEDGSILPEEEHPVVMAFGTGLPVRNKVIGMLHPEKDKYIWLLVNAIPQFKEEDSIPYQVFTTFTDITSIKQTEQELKKAKEKAEESDKLKSAFMANMSHEIRTPMNGILGFADLLRSPNLSGESQKMYIDAINSSGRRMLDIINDLVDISRIEAGLIELKKESANISDLLSELALFFMPEAEKKNIDLRLNNELGKEPFIIETDKTKVAQIITNLLKNSLKFTEKDGFVELGCKIKDEYSLLFYVKDNGRGIRKEIQNKIFERFRQGDNSGEHEGVGLGLAISKAYVELLGGKMKIESEPGRGSVFSFTLPYMKASYQVNTQDVKQTNSIPMIRVLVVEDDELNFVLLKELLSGIGISCLHARNGLEAITMVKKRSDIRLVLMDLKLPVMDGIEATREIKKIRPDIPIIAQSAYAGLAEIQLSYEAGCVDYITKPIDTRSFIEKISYYSSQAAHSAG